MEKFILDANLFFNMSAGVGLGEESDEVVVNLTKIIKELKRQKKAEFFMPPSVINEFLSFFKNKEQEFIKEFLATITIKSPEITQINFSAKVFYQLIDDIRQRSYRGLNIAEEEIENAAKKFLNSSFALSKKEFQIKIGGVIKNFRERYRHATRFGFLDSVADLDLIVLTKEQDGFLVSADEGVIKWGRFFGIKEMLVELWQKRLKALLHQE